MRKNALVSAVVFSLALAGGAVTASAQSVHFSTDNGHMLERHATGHHYSSYDEPNFHARVGVTLPSAAAIHPLPDEMGSHMPHGSSYGYSVVHGRPVIVDHSSRRIIHNFD